MASDIYGDNHSFDTAYDLGSDTAIKSADDASVTIAGEVDYFSFTLTQDADVTLRTTGGADSFDTFLYLYDGDQYEIAYNDDYGASYFSCIAERLGPGTYYATVLAYGNDTGKYSLLVTVLPDDGVSEFTGDLAGATKRILDGRSAKDVNVHDGGDLQVSSGGSVADTVVNPGGSLKIEDGGKAYNIKENGGYIAVETDRDVMFVPNTIDGLELTDQIYATLHSNTIASNVVITSATLYVYSSGSAVDTTVNHKGLLYIYNGGIASNTDVSSGGNLHIVGGGSAHEIKENGGYVSLEDGADVSFVSNSIAGLEMKEWTSASIHSGTTATGVEVKWGCRLEVHAGGIAHQVKESGGFVSVEDGADVTFVPNTFSNLEVINYNSASIHSGTTATGVEVKWGGRLEVYAGGVAHGVSENGGYVSVEDGADVTFAPNAFSGLELYASSATIHSGTTATDTVIGTDGSLFVFSEGIANGVVVSSGGSLLLSKGGKLTGTQTYEAEAVVSMAEGAVLNFDLRQAESGAEKALVNDLSIIQGTPVYTLTVDWSLKLGTYDYKLAGGASAFDGTISVENALGIELETLALDETVSVGGMNYTLHLTDSILSVTVEVQSEEISDSTPPIVSAVKADITAPTNQDVTVTASFADDMGIAEILYRVGETGKWNAYEDGVVLNENATVYFQAVDTSDNKSEIVSYEVKNIDKDEPVITLAGETEKPVRQAVLTATVDDGSPIYYYIGDDGDLMEYTGPITVTENATYYFLSADAVGNEGMNFLSFTNIDRDLPPILLAADTETPLPSSTITASAEDGLDIYYSTDGEKWTKYEAPIEVTANGTYYFNVIDADGNNVGTSSVTFENILSDEPAPEKKKWTYLVYMAADSNIGTGALYDIIGMQQAKVDSEIDIYVLADRCPEDAGYPDKIVTVNGTYEWDSLWPETRVGKITYSSGLTVTVDWESWGELDTGSSATLKRFVDWAQEESPADCYGLILWDHGGEEAELCWDLTTDPNWKACFTVSEVSALVKEKGNIPIVIFNNCLLASEIVATQMAGSTEVIVASEPVSMAGSTYNYNAFFNTITADMTPQEMAEIMVQNVESPGMLTMLSSIDVRDSRLGDALEALADAVAEAGNDADRTVLTNAMLVAYQDGFCYSGSYVQQSDLGDMIFQVLMDRDYAKTSEEFQKAILNVAFALEETVLAVRSVPVNRGNGIAYCNPIATILQCSVTGRTPEKMDALIKSHIISSYKSNPLWGGLLYDLGSTYLNENADRLFRPASFHVIDVEGLMEGWIVTALDLGCFSGKGEQNYGITLTGDVFCRIVITDKDRSSGTISVANEDGRKIDVSLLASDGSVVAEGINGIGFENLAPGDYYIRPQSETHCDVTVTFDADWMTGVDRFDYAGSGQNLPGVNGNGSIDTATVLDAGYYTGLLTCKGDTDYYRIGNIHTEQYTVVINGGEDWTVAEYDENGNLVRNGEYSELDNIITLTMDSMNYLLVEGTADLSNQEGNRYFLNIFKNENGSDDVVQLDNLAGSKDEVSWESSTVSEYVVEYSMDGFEHVLQHTTRGTAVDMLNLPDGTYQWRVKANMDNAEWNDGDTIISDNANATPKVFRSKADASDDIFFASPNGKWSSMYFAKHVGSFDDWTGTNDTVSAGGKGRIQDLFFGSADPSMLCLTDSENGDALFLDDAFTGLPEEIEENTGRLFRLQAIVAGAGDDIVDMTSQRFEYSDGNLSIFGGDGDDVIWASRGRNSLYGDAGNDCIVGASSDDLIIGGIGNDHMHGGGGDDIFTFCDNWGVDEVEQLASGKVTFWFTSELEGNVAWDEVSKSFTDGTNHITVKGFDADQVTLKFGKNNPEDTDLFTMLSDAGAFGQFTSQRIFEESKDLLA
jgi:autotransporter passenger strand-loop-strand repeat protein